MLASARRSNQRNFGGIEHLTAEQRSGIHKNWLNRLLCPRHDHLVPHFINTATFATRDFWPRRGASDAHTLPGSVRSEQQSLGQKEPSPGGLHRFSVLACSSVTAPLRGMLPRRASPEPKIDTTNVVVFMKRGTKLALN